MQRNRAGEPVKRKWSSLAGFAAAALAGAALGGGASAAPVLTETVLHSFAGGDGFDPTAGLIADSSGNLYGTTLLGGASNNGVVFKLSPGGTETLLYSFCSLSGCSDGAFPEAGLIADISGNLYGTTEIGGAAGFGVVFKLAPSGTETVLYSFAGGSSDGAKPFAGLIADSSGNLYGTTLRGGVSGTGKVFKLTPGGTETVLYSFTGGSDGNEPFAGLIADSAGNLYGTTSFGGVSNFGVVFKLTPSGTETVLHSFAGGGSDGANPEAGLIADRAGNLYGTTNAGGANSTGVVFKLSPSGTETVLYSFCPIPGCSDGAFPQAGLIADSSGNLYGTTSGGGSGRKGTVFKLAGTGFNLPTLQVSGPATIVANAAQGGAAIFSPSSFDYMLSAMNGSVQVSILASGFPPGIPAWLNPTIASATVAPGTPVTDTISLINLGSLARGSYNATVSFTNTTNDQGDTTIPATLIIYNKDDCKNGGWKNFISPPGPFPNQGQCVSYFAHLAP